MAETHDPRTHPNFVKVGSTATRVAQSLEVGRKAPSFTTFEYYVRQSDFDLLCTGHKPQGMIYRGKNNGRPSGAKPSTRAGAQLLAVWKDEQRAATYGARACEAAWRL